MTIRKSGFVALLDVLGFSDLVQRDSEAGGLDSYIDTVVQVTTHYQNMVTVLFSDTVVIFTYDDSPESFLSITSAVSGLSFSLIEQEVPIRGAIAHGTFVRSDSAGHGTVIAGRPIIEAHYFEAQLQWVGVMLAPSTLKHIGPLERQTGVSARANGEPADVFFERSLKAARIQPCDRIPVQGGAASTGHLHGYAVVPIKKDVRTPLEIRESVRLTVDKLRWLKQLAPEPRSQAKYQNSINWLAPLHTDWIPKLR